MKDIRGVLVALHELEDGAVRILGYQDGSNEYGGQAVFRHDGVPYYIEVEDHGWCSTRLGEIDEDDGTILREASGEDSLTAEVVNVASGERVVREQHIDDDMIHGLFYAATRLADPKETAPDWYHDYIVMELEDWFP